MASILEIGQIAGGLLVPVLFLIAFVVLLNVLFSAVRWFIELLRG